MSLFREPDAGDPQVRFDEREQETELCQTGLRRQSESRVNEPSGDYSNCACSRLHLPDVRQPDNFRFRNPDRNLDLRLVRQINVGWDHLTQFLAVPLRPLQQLRLRCRITFDDMKQSQLGPVLFRQRQGIGQGSRGSRREIAGIKNVSKPIPRCQLDMRANGKHRTSGVSYYLFRRRSQEQLFDSSMSLRAYHNQIDILVRQNL